MLNFDLTRMHYEPYPLAVVMLAMEIGPLVRDLHAWEPVAIRADQVLGTAAGADALTGWRVQQLRAWARRWQAMHPDLRAWYAMHAPHGAAGSGLWLVLEGKPHQASRQLVGALHNEYRGGTGHAPPWSLLPRLP